MATKKTVKKDNRVKVEVVEEDTSKKGEVEGKKEEVAPTKSSTSNVEISAENVDVEIESAQKVEIEQKGDIKTPPENIVDEDFEEKQDKIPFWVLFFAFLIGLTLGAGLIGGIFYYKANVESIPKEESKSKVTEVAQPSPSPEEGEEISEEMVDQIEEAELSEYSVQILNGSGIAGEAGRVEAIIVEAGFLDTETGNAQSYNYTNTEVSVKADTPDSVYNEMESALSSYSVVKGEQLDESSDYDIVILVGNTKSE